MNEKISKAVEDAWATIKPLWDHDVLDERRIRMALDLAVRAGITEGLQMAIDRLEKKV